MLTTDFVTGAPNWLDLQSPDTEASAGFYSAVFGWDFQSAGPDAGGYGHFRKDGKTVAALGPLPWEDAPAAWTVHFQTSDADATARAVEQAGGTVRVPPFDVRDTGRLSHLADPSGAGFAVWQPGTVKGLEAVSDTNTLFWAELHTFDATGALSFYRSLFGWRGREMKIGPMLYTVLSTAKGEEQAASFGGLVTVDGPGSQASWIPYFASDDTDAIETRVQDNGGSLVAPSSDVPDRGRIALLADPSGAAFAVINPAQPAA
ncbi:VOC family protein [Streptomyces sp. NPDC093099]|uniref:VOC family protein n=1 Tax=Streptomyces sp. NPDC093099 TaxID=3366028 RepID=UPI0037F54A34